MGHSSEVLTYSSMTCTSTALLLAIVAYQALLGIAEFSFLSTSEMQCYMKDFNVTLGSLRPNCVTEKNKRNIFITKNPVSGNCITELNATDVPGFMKIEIKKIKLNAGDDLYYYSQFFYKSLSTASTGDTIYLPTTWGQFQYYPNVAAEKEGKTFRFRTIFKKSRCHKVIFVPVGTKGRITTPGFEKGKMEKNTYCEWRIFSPEDTKIELEFTGFNVGKGNTDDCEDEDFIALSVTGDKNYRDHQKICRTTEPVTKKFTSTANKINVVAYAPNEDEESTGFSATYEAI